MGVRMLVVVVLAVVASGCGELPWSAQSSDSSDIRGEWELVAGQGPDGPLPDPDDHRATLVVEEDRLGGQAVCNHYDAGYELDGERLRIEDVAVTEMACAEGMAAQEAYVDAFTAVDRARRDGEQLVLAGDAVTLRYAPVPPTPDADSEGTR